MRLFRKLRSICRRQQLDADMAEEMRAHLELQAERNRAAGLPVEDAHHAAQREFGNLGVLQQQVREDRGWLWLEHLGRDLRFAARGLRHSPGFSLVAVVTIALAIGAGSSVFSLVNAILLRSLPVPNPQELRALHWSGAEVRMRSYNGNHFESAGGREAHDAVNHPTFRSLQEAAAGKADVFGYFPAPAATLVTPRSAFSADGLMVSDNFFSALGVRALVGRVFAAGDDAAARPQVVISHALWQRRFGADPEVVGRTVTMRGTTYVVAGVLPPAFLGIRPGNPHDFYISMSPGSPFLYVPLTDDWHWFIGMMARVVPGHSDAEVAATLSPGFARENEALVKAGRIELVPAPGGLGFDRELYGRPLGIMLGVTALVILIACANLAGLSLSRGVARTHELAVRAALGANWRRLVTQSLAESALLAVLGGGLGVLLTIWGRSALARLLAGSHEGLRYDLSLDLRVMGFNVAAIFVTALLAGLLPAVRAGRIDPLRGLRARGAGASRLGAGRVLVVAQLCVSLSVLAAAGLGLRSLLNLRAIDAGFQTDQLVLFRLNPLSAGYDAAGLVDFYRRTQSALEAAPGVKGVAIMQYVLLSGRESSGGFRFADDSLPPGENHWTSRLAVGETFFATMGIPVLRGRGIEATDRIDASVKACVVNETFARRVSPDRDPIGRTFNMWSAEWRIVGVCGDAKFGNVKEAAQPMTYFAFAQSFYGRFRIEEACFAVRSPLPASALRRPIEQAVATVNPAVPVVGFTTQNEVRDSNVGRERLLALLCAALAAVALVLCCIGLYGLIAYEVSRRTSEIAIRMAIGARPLDVARPILREALLLTGTGIGLGLPAAFLVQRLIRNQLYGVAGTDPLVLALVCGSLVAVALLAAWVPARRAMKVDPLVALRAE